MCVISVQGCAINSAGESIRADMYQSPRFPKMLSIPCRKKEAKQRKTIVREGLDHMILPILLLTPRAALFAVFLKASFIASSASHCPVRRPLALYFKSSRPLHACCSGSLWAEQNTFPQKRHLKGIYSSLPHIQHFLSNVFTIICNLRI